MQKQILKIFFILAVFLLMPGFAKAAPDTITITEKAGVSNTNYPVQIGRPFVQGEIANFPQAVVNSTPLPTQADVKTRWPDGSAKHAIISFLLPTLPANGTVTVSFRNQSSSNNTPLSKAEMLDARYDFDAKMELTDPNTSTMVSASARQMLQNGDFTYWTSGPVATTVILADHSVNRIYDIGFDQYKSFRPIFQATFWPGINKVRVRYIGENSNTEALQDLTYDLSLKLGLSSSQTVYSKSSLNHFAATRWTKEFWIGGSPEKEINISHNLAYLAQTYLFPNYDSSLSLPTSVISSDYSNWQSKQKDIGDDGLWTKSMPTTGGRPDIGAMPAWTVNWLYTGDYREKEISLTQADLAASWPLQVREGDVGKKMDSSQTISAMGKPISVYARPTLWLFDDRATPVSNDAVSILGSRILNPNTYPQTWDGWTNDGAHQPDPFFAQYILSGDYWYLEEMQMWASADALSQCPGTGASYCRGLGAGIQDQVRGDAWLLRNRVNAAVASPDGSVEKSVFTSMVDDALALWEGQRNITGTVYENNAQWNWAKDSSVTHPENYYPGTGRWNLMGVPPLHFWESNTGAIENLSSITAGGTSPWMQNYLIMEIGRSAELGYPAGPLLSWVGSNLVGQLTDPGFNHYLSCSYRTPVMKTDNTYFSNWTDVMAGYLSTDQNLTTWPAAAYPTCTDCYTFNARAATALASVLPGGSNAWNEINTLIGPTNLALLNDNPQWAIVPRQQIISDTTVPAAPSGLSVQ